MGGKGPTAEKSSRRGRDRDRDRGQDPQQGQTSSTSTRDRDRDQPRTERTSWEESPSHRGADHPFEGVNYTHNPYPAYDSRNQSAGGTYPPELEQPRKSSAQTREKEKSSKPAKESGTKSSSKPKDSRQSKPLHHSVTSTTQHADDYYNQGYGSAEHHTGGGDTGLESRVAGLTVQEQGSFGGTAGQGWQDYHDQVDYYPSAQGQDAQVEHGEEPYQEQEGTRYAAEEGDAQQEEEGGETIPWEVEMNFRTRRLKEPWGSALGLIDTGNRIGPMILSQKVFELGYSHHDIDDDMFEFSTIAGRAKTAGSIKLQYHTAESDGQCVEATFHVLAKSFLVEYDVFLTWKNTIPRNGQKAVRSISAFSSHKRKLSKEEKKEMKELLSRQHKGVKQGREKMKAESASTSYSYPSQGNAGPEQPYVAYDPTAAEQGPAYTQGYPAQYPSAGQAQFPYPATGYETEPSYPPEAYQQTNYHQTNYPQQGYNPAGGQQTNYDQTGGQPTVYEQDPQQQAGYPQGTYPATGYEYEVPKTTGSKARSSKDYQQDPERKAGGSSGSRNKLSGRGSRR